MKTPFNPIEFSSLIDSHGNSASASSRSSGLDMLPHQLVDLLHQGALLLAESGFGLQAAKHQRRPAAHSDVPWPPST
jgi:hypothetical protein